MPPDPTDEQQAAETAAPERLTASARVDVPLVEPGSVQEREELVKEAQAYLAEADAVMQQLAAAHGEKYLRARNKLHEAIGALQ